MAEQYSRTRLLLGRDALDALVFSEAEAEELSQTGERALGGLALGFLFRAARALRKALVPRENLRDERAVMRRPLGLDKLVGRRDAVFLQLLLQGALGIFWLFRHVDRHAVDERSLDERMRRLDTAVEEQCGDNGLVDVFQGGMQSAPTRTLLR